MSRDFCSQWFLSLSLACLRMSRSYKDAAVIIKQAGALVFNMSAVVGRFPLVSRLLWFFVEFSELEISA